VADEFMVDQVQFTPASAEDRATGLLGWVSCSFGALRLDGIAVRRKLRGGRTLSFPKGRGGCFPVRPIDDDARQAIERDVFDGIDLDGGGAR